VEIPIFHFFHKFGGTGAHPGPHLRAFATETAAKRESSRRALLKYRK
jgi:hypothetical protein